MTNVDAVNRVRAIKGRSPVATGADDHGIEEVDDGAECSLDSLSGGINPGNDPGYSGEDARERVRALKRDS